MSVAALPSKTKMILDEHTSRSPILCSSCDMKKPDPVFDTGSFLQLHGPSPHARV
jgi:hypothetical protein